MDQICQLKVSAAPSDPAHPDPEDGIDANIEETLTGRRANTKVITWEMLWRTIFPDDDAVNIPDPREFYSSLPIFFFLGKTCINNSFKISALLPSTWSCEHILKKNCQRPSPNSLACLENPSQLKHSATCCPPSSEPSWMGLTNDYPTRRQIVVAVRCPSSGTLELARRLNPGSLRQIWFRFGERKTWNPDSVSLCRVSRRKKK